MPRVYVSSRGNAGVSFGCLGTLAIGFLYLLAALFFVAVVAAVIGAFLVAILLAWAAVGIDRLLVAISPKWRARRVARGPFRPVERVTGSATRAVDRSKPRRR